VCAIASELRWTDAGRVLNGRQFDFLLAAETSTKDWRIDNDDKRLHSAHDWLTPVEFVEARLHRQAHPLA
jgi:hypothetical protein